MESPEIRHDRYRQVPTAWIQVHEVLDPTFRDDSARKVQKLMLHYNNEVRNGNLDHGILDALFTTLCYEYQARIQSKVGCIPDGNVDHSFFRGILEVLLKNAGNLDEKTANLLLDIFVLEIVLYDVNDEIKLIASTIVGSNETILQIISNIIDALYLKSFIHEGNGGNQSGLIQMLEPLKKMLKSTPDANDKHSALLSFTIHKLMITFFTQDVVYFLWSTIMADEHSDGKDKQLKLLTIALESILSVKNNINVIYVCKDEFWRLICYGLMSDVEEQQKQALYLMKKTLDYVDKEDIAVQKGSLVPFAGCQGDGGRKSAKEMQTQFLLILECLEEKQAHLVLPTLTHLDNLVECSSLHEACGNCFDQLYLHCIFKRILKHKTSSVVKKGLSHLLRMNPAMFDDEYITMLVDSLNKTSLYSSTSTDTPEIVRELADLFVKAENSQVNLINKFICRASVCNWNYIPFFYLIESLNQTVSKLDTVQSNVWTLKEYEAIVKMVEKNITGQTPPLRKIIDENIGRILSCYVGKEIGLDSIALILFALGNFYDPYLTHDTFDPPVSIINNAYNHLEYSCSSNVWGGLIDYLKEKVRDEDVLAYVRRCCAKLREDTTANEINVKYFAVMIGLLARAEKDFSPSAAYGDALSRVIDFICYAQMRPNENMTVLLKTIELFTCLIKLLRFYGLANDSPSAYGIKRIISSYEEPMFRFIGNNSSKIPESYNQAQICIGCFKIILQHSKLPNFYVPLDFWKFLEDAWNTICESTRNADIKFWYALQIATACSQRRIYPKVSSKHLEQYWTALMEKQSLNLVIENDDSEKILGECYETICQLIYQYYPYLRSVGISSPDKNQVLSALCSLIKNGKKCSMIPWIVRTLNIMLPAFGTMHQNKTLTDVNYSKKLFVLSWNVLMNSKKTSLFWVCSIFLIRQVVQSFYKELPVSSSMAINCLKTWISDADNTRSSRMILASEICRQCRTNKLPFKGKFSLLLHTPLTWFLKGNPTINQKIDAQIVNHNLFEEIFGKPFENNFGKHYWLKQYTDSQFRVKCIMVVVQQIANASMVELIVDTLIAKLKYFEGTQYARNSQMHLQKLRVMQLLLLSYPHWSQATAKLVHDSICHFILHEIDQPSVRVMQQWLLALIYIKNPTMQERVWELLQEGKNKRPECIGSLATVIYHVSLRLSGKEKCSFIGNAVRKLLPCCQSQQFEVRQYSQVILSEFFREIREKSDLSPEYSLLLEEFRVIMQQGGFENHSVELLDGFLFTLFDPIKNFDVQTIFYDLPRLLGMSMDECIHPKNFLDYIDEQVHRITVENPSSKLSSV